MEESHPGSTSVVEPYSVQVAWDQGWVKWIRSIV